MKRRLIRQAPVALACAFTVFIVLNVAAWYNLRGCRKVCRRQDSSRDLIRALTQQIETFRKEHDAYPKSLSEIAHLWQTERHSDEPPTDAWGTPFIYTSFDRDFRLRSLGRDRVPGGVGLDADIDSRDLNSENSLATFHQFFTESDSEEVDRGRFQSAGLFASIVVVLTAFDLFRDLDTDEKQLKIKSFLVYSMGIVTIATIVGTILMPLHIPSGH